MTKSIVVVTDIAAPGINVDGGVNSKKKRKNVKEKKVIHLEKYIVRSAVL